MYNYSNITNATDMYGIFFATNELSGGLLASVMLLMLFLIIFVVFKGRYDPDTVLLGDSFVCTIIGIIMFWLGFIGWPILVPCMLIFFAMIIYKLFTG